MTKTKLFSVTKKDCRWDYYKGSGAGGQKRNKTENCCRCTHIASGAVGKSEEGRSKEQNKIKAFRRMSETKEFKEWIRIEVARVTGAEEELKKKIERELAINTKIEVKDKEGKWEDEANSTR
jgi:protein subunit release factor B